MRRYWRVVQRVAGTDMKSLSTLEGKLSPPFRLAAIKPFDRNIAKIFPIRGIPQPDILFTGDLA